MKMSNMVTKKTDKWLKQKKQKNYSSAKHTNR